MSIFIIRWATSLRDSNVTLYFHVAVVLQNIDHLPINAWHSVHQSRSRSPLNITDGKMYSPIDSSHVNTPFCFYIKVHALLSEICSERRESVRESSCIRLFIQICIKLLIGSFLGQKTDSPLLLKICSVVPVQSFWQTNQQIKGQLKVPCRILKWL